MQPVALPVYCRMDRSIDFLSLMFRRAQPSVSVGSIGLEVRWSVRRCTQNAALLNRFRYCRCFRSVFVLSQLGLQRLVIRGRANVLVVKNVEPPIFLASPQTGRSQRKGLMGTTTWRARSAGQLCNGGERRSSFLSRYGLILAQLDADRNGNLFSAPSKSQPSRRLMSPLSLYASAPLIWQNPQNEKLWKPGCSMTPAPLRRVSASPSKASSGGM
ncbi:unnamed protein product [Sphagnum troendelagicum]